MHPETILRRLSGLALLAALACPSAALAAPGLGSEVYGASVEKGELETEIRYDRLNGGADQGEDALVLEGYYGVSDRFRIGLRGEFEREPGAPRKAEELGIEGLWRLGSAGPVDVAVYGEYELGLNGPDGIETKLILQHRKGPVDVRFNLIAEKKLAAAQKVELGYAFSADVQTLGELRLGVQAFGELGECRSPTTKAEHFIGPVAKIEIEGLGPEMELEAGYLFAVGRARDDSKGQVRIGLEFEF